MYCKYCGKQIRDGSRFCEYCGGEQKVQPGDLPGGEGTPQEAPASPRMEAGRGTKAAGRTRGDSGAAEKIAGRTRGDSAPARGGPAAEKSRK